MIRFIRKKVYKIEWETWCIHKKEIFQEVGESDNEVIMIYKNQRYYGYIDMQFPLNIMVSECEPEYEPLELIFNDDIVEMAYDQFMKCNNLTLIPLKLEYKNDVMIFICNIPPDVDYDHYMAALCVLDTYDGNERTKKFFMEKFLGHKKGFILSDLDEFTFKCYKILKKENVKIWCEGYLWPLVGIHTDNTELIPEGQIIHVTPQNVNAIGQFAYTQECVWNAEELYRKGIEAYTLLIPVMEELENINALEEIMYKQRVTFPKLIENHDTELGEMLLRRLLEIEDNAQIELSEQEFVHPTVLGDGENIIYLIGACNVEGTTYLESASLANILYKKCVASSWNYKICRVVIPVMSMDIQQRVEELNIKEADKVFFVCSAHPHSESKRCIDMLSVYNARKEDELFFSDFPMHTLRVGNEAIAECMLPYMDEIKTVDRDKKYLQVSKPRLSVQERKKLNTYIDNIKQREYRLEKGGENTGAIVMNANPFTLGHLHLIEKAAGQVTLLYIFVVQEDLSEFCFEDRFQLVKGGTAHLKNVVVVPSGSFVLSRHTMSAYFEKETLQESRIDASKDVAIFGSYIAPALSISVRFIGEEPFDSVIRQYNEEMKKKLPLYGIKVVEIPRTGVDGMVISASVVRSLYQKQKWEEIEKMLPEVTLRFLKTKPEMRNKKSVIAERMESRTGAEQKGVFATNDKVVFYPAGQSGKEKFEKLSEEEKKKVYFVDIRAAKGNYMFCGKDVMSPQKLLNELEEAPIMVTSKKYQSEICRYLLKLGVDLDRLYQF